MRKPGDLVRLRTRNHCRDSIIFSEMRLSMRCEGSLNAGGPSIGSARFQSILRRRRYRRDHPKVVTQVDRVAALDECYCA